MYILVCLHARLHSVELSPVSTVTQVCVLCCRGVGDGPETTAQVFAKESLGQLALCNGCKL